MAERLPANIIIQEERALERNPVEVLEGIGRFVVASKGYDSEDLALVIEQINRDYWNVHTVWNGGENLTGDPHLMYRMNTAVIEESFLHGDRGHMGLALAMESHFDSEVERLNDDRVDQGDILIQASKEHGLIRNGELPTGGNRG